MRLHPRVGVLIAVAALSLSSFAHAEIKAISQSSAKGPTLLVLTERFKGDLSIDVALAQVANWPLTRGRLMTATVDELPAALKAASPDALLVFRTVRSTKEHATVAGRGIDARPLIESLNKLAEENGEQLTPAENDADLPAGDAKAINALRVSLVVKKGGTNPAARARMFRNTLHAVLTANGMTAADPWTLAKKTPGQINVAVYVGVGSDATPGVTEYPRCLTMDFAVRYTFVGAMEIRQPGVLDQFDAVVFPGGMSNTQGKILGEEGVKKVTDFVKGGGGYVSSCAGSYLASSYYTWSLHILNAKVLDANHWLRGTGDVDIELTDEGRKILGDYSGLLKVHYANGPLLAPDAKENLPAFKPLAHFRSDMAKSAPGGVMPGTPAIVAAEFGQGRMICFSPHPEYGPGLEEFISRAVRWTVKQPAAETSLNGPRTGTPAVMTNSQGPTTQPASRPAALANSKQTPFVVSLLRNWSRWDVDHDNIITAKEADQAVADPANKGDDAAAAASLKLLMRTPKVTEPLTREYFAKYNQAALPLIGKEPANDAELDIADAQLPGAMPTPTERSGKLPADWDRYFARCKTRIEKRGDAAAWPADVTKVASLERMSQGPLGDCFFIASLGSAVAHRPALIKDFVQAQPDGRYVAKFPATRPIEFAPITDAQVALSSTTAGDGAWIAVLEQAFGKYKSLVKGGSADVDGTDILRRGGDSAVTIGQLTGHATRRIRFPVSAEQRAAEKDKVLPEVRKELLTAMDEHRIITAGVDPPATIKQPADGGTATLPRIPPGIHKNHVYAIVSYDAKSDVVEIWNPHGQTTKPKGPAGLENGYVTEHGRFKLPLAEAYSFYTSFTFELNAPATKPTKPSGN